MKNVQNLDFLIIFLLTFFLPRNQAASLCETENGQSNIILDIQESRGNQTNQTTTPQQLPIIGSAGEEVELRIVNAARPVFSLNGNRLELIAPIDRDQDDLSSIILQVSCTIRATGKRRSIPVIVRLTDINDNRPQFVNEPYQITLPESTPVGATVFRELLARDLDAGTNGVMEYRIVPIDKSPSDGFEHFRTPFPHQPVLTLARPLDYERTPIYYVKVLAADRAFNVNDRLTATTTLTLRITDVDDQPPVFRHPECDKARNCDEPEYRATVTSGILSDVLTILPERIQAVDGDSLNAQIRYSFLNGWPASYAEYFEIHPLWGAVRQIKPVERHVSSSFEISVKAEEISDGSKFAKAKLVISVKGANSSPPQIVPSYVEGIVEENSPMGTVVVSLRDHNQPIKIHVVEPDLGFEDVFTRYKIELTTTAFAVDNNGRLVVSQPNLDRDPPNPGQLTFQVLAREIDGNGRTAPVTLTVHLIDVNDNTPVLTNQKPVSIAAGEGQRIVTQVQARDEDWAENGRITYTIEQVSNNGQELFSIHPRTGIIEAAGRLKAGEQFSLLVRATDGGGRYSQNTLPVIVSTGPNIKAPIFTQNVYDAQISEGAPLGATVLTIQAQDPEGEPVTYSIAEGNEFQRFTLDALTGILSIAQSVDREERNRYTLVVRGEDQGGKFSTATVNVKITDINDRNPEFIDTPYVFSVREGDLTRYVGRIHAMDADIDLNGRVTYSLADDSLFQIDSNSGEIRTRTPLDYERQKIHTMLVTAKDGGSPPRISSATVTVSVTDVSDEVPVFRKLRQEAVVPENQPLTYVTQVQAEDLDLKPAITYVIKQGATEKFSIDPQSGIIRTRKGLDYEQESQHVLVVGTLENNGNGPGAVTTVVVNVQDKNDHAPIFTTNTRSIRLQDSVSVGHVVTKLIALDADGTAPANQVKYEITGRGKATQYFAVHPDSGILQTKSDLRKEFDTEYTVEVRAFDLGEPRMAVTLPIVVYVDRTINFPSSVPRMAFSDQFYTAAISEDAFAKTLIKEMAVIHKARTPIPFSCEITSGNEEDVFYVESNVEQNCELRLKREALDFENRTTYSLVVRFNTLTEMTDNGKTSTRVDVKVLDVNDVTPRFVFASPESQFTGERIFLVVKPETEILTPFAHIQAKDLDSGKFGQLEYALSAADDDLEGYFSINANSGVLQAEKSLAGVANHSWPIRLTARVRDNPREVKGYREASVPVIINLLGKANEIVMVLRHTPPELVRNYRSRIIQALQDQTRLIVRIERVERHRYLSDNNTLDSDNAGTDIVFYCIDPVTETIMSRSHPRIVSSLLSVSSTSDIISNMAQTLKLSVADIREPLTVLPTLAPTRTGRVLTEAEWGGVPSVLIAVAVVIVIIGVIGMIFICAVWKKYKKSKERMERLFVLPSFGFNQSSAVQVSPKQYETQVLAMNLNNGEDTDSYDDLKLDFSARNHVFTVADSYGTVRSSPMHKSPFGSESSQETTIRTSSLIGQSQFVRPDFLKEIESPEPTTNPLYHESEDESEAVATSATNENVIFRQRPGRLNYNHSPTFAFLEEVTIESSTEL